MNSHPAVTGNPEDSAFGSPAMLRRSRRRTRRPVPRACPVPLRIRMRIGRQVYTAPYKTCRYPVFGMIPANAHFFSVGMPSAYSYREFPLRFLVYVTRSQSHLLQSSHPPTPENTVHFMSEMTNCFRLHLQYNIFYIKYLTKIFNIYIYFLWKELTMVNSRWV